jgi:putative endonuclease
VSAGAAPWSVYLARCADGTLYCGIARDVAARVAAHDAGRGARYTRGRGPLVVVATRRFRAKGTALRVEAAVKRLPRATKLALASGAASLEPIVRRARAAAARARRA